MLGDGEHAAAVMAEQHLCPSQMPSESSVTGGTHRVPFASVPLSQQTADASAVLPQIPSLSASMTSCDVARETAIIASTVRQQLEDTIRTAIREELQESVNLIRDGSTQLASLVKRLQKLCCREMSSSSRDAGILSDLSCKHDVPKQKIQPSSSSQCSESKRDKQASVQFAPGASSSPAREHSRDPDFDFDQVAPVSPSGQASSPLWKQRKPTGHAKRQHSGISSESNPKAGVGAASVSLKAFADRPGNRKERITFKSLEDKLQKDLFLKSMSPDVFKVAAPVNSCKVSPLWNAAEADDRQSRPPKAKHQVAKTQKGVQSGSVVESHHDINNDANLAVGDYADYKRASSGDLPMLPKTLEKFKSERSESVSEESENEEVEKELSISPSGRSNSIRRGTKHLSALRQLRQQELTVAIGEQKQVLSPAEEELTVSEEKPSDRYLKRRCNMVIERIGGFIARFLTCIAGVEDVSGYGMCNLLFQICMMLSGVGSLAANFVVWRRQSDLPDDQRVGLPGLLVEMALSAGAVFGLLACRLLRANQSSLGCDEMLLAFAEQKDFAAELAPRQSWDACSVMACWFLAVAERLREVLFRTPLEMQADVQAFVPVLSFAVSSGFLIALLFSFLRICLSLHVMIDDFSSRVVCTADFCNATDDWNVLQALLRSSCARAQYLFMVLQTTILASVTLGVFDFYNTPGSQTVFIAPAILLTGVAQLFLRASTVTDHCERLPSFVNSLSFGETCSQDRMYLVEYILHSKAGFYVFEVRLTSGIVLKAFYVLCMGLFALVTKIMTEL